MEKNLKELETLETIDDLGKTKLDFAFYDSEEDLEFDCVAIEGVKYNNMMYLKLKMASDIIKEYYSNFRKELDKYEKLSFRSTNNGDIYLYKNKVVLKVSVYSRALKVYMALDSKELDALYKYSIDEITDDKKYKNISMMMRVSNKETFNQLLEVFNVFVKKYKLPLKKEFSSINYVDDISSNSQEILQLLGYQDLLSKTATIKTCENIPDNVAKNCQILVTKTNNVATPRVVHEVTIGELSAAFKDKYEITLELLKEVGIASKKSNYLRVIAKGDCRYKLTVFADDYDLQSLKMIVMTGGNVTKYL